MQVTTVNLQPHSSAVHNFLSLEMGSSRRGVTDGRLQLPSIFAVFWPLAACMLTCDGRMHQLLTCSSLK
jgi:hypothetical protein